MIRYVKDKDNLAPYNFWSGGDYNKSTSGLVCTPSTCVSASNETSVKGDYSFKLTKLSSATYNWGGRQSLTVDNLNGKTLTIKCDAIASLDAKLQLIYGTENMAVTISSSDTFQEVTLSKEFSEDVTNIDIAFFIYSSHPNEEYLILDNFRVTVN